MWCLHNVIIHIYAALSRTSQEFATKQKSNTPDNVLHRLSWDLNDLEQLCADGRKWLVEMNSLI